MTRVPHLDGRFLYRILSHVELRPNDHREDITNLKTYELEFHSKMNGLENYERLEQFNELIAGTLILKIDIQFYFTYGK